MVHELADWMRAERGRLSRHAKIALAIDYLLKRWAAFIRFLDDGRICLTNSAAERALRGIALGRKAWAVCRLGPRRRTRRGHLHAGQHRQTQRRRPASLACRRLAPYRRSSSLAARCTPALVLEENYAQVAAA